MRSLIKTEGKISVAARNALARASAREFFEGDLEVEAGPIGNFSFHKGLQFPVAVTHLCAVHCRLGYRRNWQHIRANPVGFRVIWLVTKGSLQISRSIGGHVVGAGQAAFIDSGLPFFAKTDGDEDGKFESFQILVPGYLFVSRLQEADHLTRPLDVCGSHGALAREIVHLLGRAGEGVSQRVASRLTDSLLASLTYLLEQQSALVTRGARIGASRFREFKSYIEANVQNPELSLASAVSHLGVSARYLCYVLNAHQTTFSKILWNGRLHKARDLLDTLKPDLLIESTARLSGFKSAAHFSRLFKAEFGETPTQYRRKIVEQRLESV